MSQKFVDRFSIPPKLIGNLKKKSKRNKLAPSRVLLSVREKESYEDLRNRVIGALQKGDLLKSEN